MNRILVVDDDTFICNILEKLLTDEGYKVDTSFSAASADKNLKKTKYDLVICDFRLPDSDGIKMLEKIKNSDPNISVVIITAYADVRIAVKLMKLGAADYVLKNENSPYRLVNAIEECALVTKNRKMKQGFSIGVIGFFIMLFLVIISIILITIIFNL